MRNSFVVLACGILALSLAQLSPSVQANPRASPTLVVDVVGFTDFGNGTWVARLNFSFERSPDDGGSFGYTICGYTSEALPADVASGAVLPFSCLSANSSMRNIPNRSGWAWSAGLSTNTDSCAGTPSANYCASVPAVESYNVTAWDGTTPTVSCSVAVDFSSVPYLANDPGATFGNETIPTLLFPHGDPDYVKGKPTYHACGVHANLADVPGVNGIVASPYFGANSTTPSLTVSTWRLSPSDPNNTTGEFDYYFFHRYSDPPQPGLVVRGTLDARDSTDPAGIRQSNVTGFDEAGVWNALYLQVIARDNLTHQQSNLSCAAFVREGILYSAAGCGNLAAPDSPVAVGSGPSFPGLDVPAFAISTGLTIENAGYFLAGLLVFGLVLLGAFLARGVGAGLVGALGIALSYQLHILPAWLIILLFTLAVVVVVLFAQSKRGRTP